MMECRDSVMVQSRVGIVNGDYWRVVMIIINVIVNVLTMLHCHKLELGFWVVKKVASDGIQQRLYNSETCSDLLVRLYCSMPVIILFANIVGKCCTSVATYS